LQEPSGDLVVRAGAPVASGASLNRLTPHPQFLTLNP